jgi:PKD repeat protein
VTGSFQLITPLLSVVFGGQTIPLSSSATAQVAYYPDPNLATLPPSPVANFTMSPSGGSVLETITFDASASTGNPADYQWDFGDGTQVVTQTPTVTHAYLLPDVYTVTLTVVNLTTADIEQKTITIGAVPGQVLRPRRAWRHRPAASIPLTRSAWRRARPAMRWTTTSPW